MALDPITEVELFHVALPPRRAHKWTGQTEPIGGYILVRLGDAAGRSGWGEATALKDWAGDYGRYFGESPATARLVIERYLDLNDPALDKSKNLDYATGSPLSKPSLDELHRFRIIAQKRFDP